MLSDHAPGRSTPIIVLEGGKTPEMDGTFYHGPAAVAEVGEVFTYLSTVQQLAGRGAKSLPGRRRTPDTIPGKSIFLGNRWLSPLAKGTPFGHADSSASLRRPSRSSGRHPRAPGRLAPRTASGSAPSRQPPWTDSKYLPPHPSLGKGPPR